MKSKQILSFLLAFLISVSMIAMPVTANEENESTDSDIYDILSNTVASCTAYITDELNNAYNDGGVKCGYEWHIISLLRAGKLIDAEILDQYYDSVCEYAAQWNEETLLSDIERVILALTAMGKDPCDINGVNAVELMCNSTALEGSSNNIAYALIALAASGVDVPGDVMYDTEKLISELLTFRLEDGSFGLYGSDKTDADITAICIQALAPYKDTENIQTVIDEAAEFLITNIVDYENYNDNPNTAAQILLALTSAGTDDDFSEIITYLTSFENPEGNGFIYGNSVNTMATIQIMQSCDAFRKMNLENISYWDFSVAGEEYEDIIKEENPGDDTESDGDEETEIAPPADIYVTIASDGKIVTGKDEVPVAMLPVTVTDINSDGILSVDEALTATHKMYFDGELTDGYLSYDSPFGLSVAKLWGSGSVENPASVGYWLNNQSCWSLFDEVKEGDVLKAFNYFDAVSFSDAYSYFVSADIKVEAGEKAELELVYLSGYDAENNYAPVFSPCENACVTFIGVNNYNDEIYITDKDGKVSIKFSSSADSGVYSLMAYMEDNSIVPAVCKITVEEKKEDSGSSGGVSDSKNMTVYLKVADPKGKTYHSKKSYQVKKGTTVLELVDMSGIEYETEKNAYGAYISSVGGLAEFDEGPESGWMYRVNGKFPDYPISSYVLSSKDYVEILYTRSHGEDIGDNTIKKSSSSSASGTRDEYKVVFETNCTDSIKSQKITKNGHVSEPELIKKDGYEFGGWYTDSGFENLYDFESPVTKDFTLYAKWNEIADEQDKTSDEADFDENVFADVKSDDWFFDSVEFVYENGLMEGTGVLFEPEKNITRAMFITVLWRMADKPDADCVTSFEDVESGSWYSNAVLWAESEKISSGVGNNMFGVNDEITREQLVTLLYRYIKTQNGAFENDDTENLTAYSDYMDVSEYSVDAMEWAVNCGILKGSSGKMLNPGQPATRAEVSAILKRFCEE